MGTPRSRRFIQPYLFFNGRCDEALESYRSAIGSEVLVLMPFKDSPGPTPPGMLAPGFEEKIMHAEVRLGETTLMAADGCSAEAPGF